MKNLRNDLKNSLENLEVRMEAYREGKSESLYPHTLWEQKEKVEEKILDRRFQIAVLDLLHEMNIDIGESSEINEELVRDDLIEVSGFNFDVQKAREIDDEVRRRFLRC